MAAPRKTTDNKPAQAFTFEVATDIPKTKRSQGRVKPIVTLDAVQQCADKFMGQKRGIRIPFGPGQWFDNVKDLTNDLRRAGSNLGVGVSIIEASDHVYVTVRKAKQMTYTAQDIKTWAKNTPEVAAWCTSQGIDLDDTGRLDNRVRELYRVNVVEPAKEAAKAAKQAAKQAASK